VTEVPESFRALGVSEPVAAALEARGIVEPFPIQWMVWEDARSGRDTLARSKTGSGKTLGFALPIVDRLDPSERPLPAALVLVPTRELAQQVREDMHDIAKAAHRELVDLSGVRVLVLDEADRMLDMGFQPQVDRIVRRLPKDRQTMFFSATLDGAVGRIAQVYTRDPVLHEVAGHDRQTVEEADHRFVAVPTHEKLSALIELAAAQDGLTLVFVNTKRAVDSLARQLKAQGVPALAMHGDMRQEARDRALKRFEGGHVGVLVATDVAARGLDLDDITLVVNYDAPLDDKSYVHRVGRTARAGRAGTSITFVTPEQQGDVSRMAARLDLHEEFEQEGMKVAPPRVVFSGGPKGRRGGMRRPPKRR
jgi:superfamily II DNA/RNA helicase